MSDYQEWYATQGYAPELYKCLKTLVQDIDEWNEAVEQIIGKFNTTWGDLEEARALLKKVEDALH